MLPELLPEYFFKTAGGALSFAVAGHNVTTLDYLVKLSTLEAPLSPALNLRRVQAYPNDRGFAFDMARYLRLRGDTKASGNQYY